MATGRAKAEWVIAAHLICVIANSAGDGRHQVKFEDVYPFPSKRHGGGDTAPADMEVVKQVWLKATEGRG